VSIKDIDDDGTQSEEVVIKDIDDDGTRSEEVVIKGIYDDGTLFEEVSMENIDDDGTWLEDIAVEICSGGRKMAVSEVTWPLLTSSGQKSDGVTHARGKVGPEVAVAQRETVGNGRRARQRSRRPVRGGRADGAGEFPNPGVGACED